MATEGEAVAAIQQHDTAAALRKPPGLPPLDELCLVTLCGRITRKQSHGSKLYFLQVAELHGDGDSKDETELSSQTSASRHGSQIALNFSYFSPTVTPSSGQHWEDLAREHVCIDCECDEAGTSSGALPVPVSPSPQGDAQLFKERISLLVPGTIVAFVGMEWSSRYEGQRTVYARNWRVLRIHPEFSSLDRVLRLHKALSVSPEEARTCLDLKCAQFHDLCDKRHAATNPLLFLDEEKDESLETEDKGNHRKKKGAGKKGTTPDDRRNHRAKKIQVAYKREACSHCRYNLSDKSFKASRAPHIPTAHTHILETCWKQHAQVLGPLESVLAPDFSLASGFSDHQTLGRSAGVEPPTIESSPRRLEYMVLKKMPQVQWFLSALRSGGGNALLPSIVTESTQRLRVLDVGGGKGDLAIAVALEFPAVDVYVVDSNSTSLRAGKRRAALLNVDNVKFHAADVRDLLLLHTHASHSTPLSSSEGAKEGASSTVPKCDVVIGLHTCGGLADCALAVACNWHASFLLVPCCYGKHVHLAKGLNDGSWRNTPTTIGSKDDPCPILCRLAELPHRHYPDSKLAMHTINSMRLAWAEAFLSRTEPNINAANSSSDGNRGADGSQSSDNREGRRQQFVKELGEFPHSFSPKNCALKGYFVSV
jgi:SAM-dependent methyltransferase